MNYPLLFVTLIGFISFSSCSDELEERNRVELSGIITQSDLPYTIHIEDKQFTILSIYKDQKPFKNSFPLTDDINIQEMETIGPLSSTGIINPFSLNHKIYISYQEFQGNYLCNTYKHKNDITLPSNTVAVTIGIPEPYTCFLTSSAPFKEGIQWKITFSSTQLFIRFTYYTVLLISDSKGRHIGEIIPVDGGKVLSHYSYILRY